QGMVRGAEELQAWRAGDHPRLSPEARGLALSLEFANYCAWFAPQEKVFANTRYRHHRRELGTFTTVRKALGLLAVPEEDVPTSRELNDTLEELGVEYLVIHASSADAPTTRFLAQQASVMQWFLNESWSPWYLDGQSTICGWRKAPGKERPSFHAMQFDPLMMAFGPDVKPLPPGSISPIQKPGGWEDAFLRSPRVTPPAVDEALSWPNYKFARTRFAQKEIYPTWRGFQVLGNRLAEGWPAVAGIESDFFRLTPAYPMQDELYAVPFLALRAAYRAIAADPDHPDGYFALAEALKDRNLPLDEAPRVIGRITALRQCLARFPSPENYRSSGCRAIPADVAFNLARLYLGRREDVDPRAPMPIIGYPVNHMSFRLLNQPRGSGYLPAASLVYANPKGGIGREWSGNVGQLPPQMLSNAIIVLLPLDEARDMLQLAKQYLQVDPQFSRESRDKVQEVFDRELKSVEEDLIRANNRLAQRQLAGGGQLKLETQVEAALQNNLIGEALRLLRENADNLGKEFGARAAHVLLSQIALEMAVGRIEEAAADLDALENDGGLQKLLADPNFRQIVQMLRFHKCVMEGNFAGAGKIIEGLEGEYSTRDAYRDARKKFDPNPFVKAGMQSVALWQFYSPLSSILAPTPGDLIARLFAPTVVIDGTGNNVGFASLQYQLSRLRQTEGEFYLRRGMLSLQEGDIKAARQRFLQTRDTEEQQAENAKWGLPNRRFAPAEQYLRLIDKAAARAHQK
ncbi:MAG TPA: hypothetical protein VLM40_04125, partial [Gemmata sp.]|nr:hypothetical protein [Gemmata sp.]